MPLVSAGGGLGAGYPPPGAPLENTLHGQASCTLTHMPEAEMPIFTRTFDLLTWLLPVTNQFPRAQRFTFTSRLLDAAFDLREALEDANLRRGAARKERLQRADEALARLRVYLRLAARWRWLSAGQYRHVASQLAEVGRLLGGWMKVTGQDG